MNGSHYDEEALIELIERGEAAVARDEHVTACAECADTIASIREFTEALKSDDVWHGPDLNPEPNAQVLATLRAAQARMRAEGAAAEIAIKELLAGPRETWMPRLQEHPEWRTAGMVRKLIAATDRAIETMPPDALEIANVAAEIADKLGEERYAAEEVWSLRAGAWREKAYALYVVGRYHDAMAAIHIIQGSVVALSLIDAARIQLVGALVASELERFSEATDAAQGAAAIFALTGENKRYVAAQRTKGIIHFRARQFRSALECFQPLEFENNLPLVDRAGVLQNIAVTYRETGEIEKALAYITRSMQLFQRAGHVVGVTRTRWHLGRTFIAQARYSDALTTLGCVRDDFRDMQMLNEAAIVSLDIAHVRLLLGDDPGVITECHQVIAYYDSANLTYTESALTAVAFLKEAATVGRANAQIVTYVRNYVEELPRRQSARFVPPPLTS